MIIIVLNALFNVLNKTIDLYVLNFEWSSFLSFLKSIILIFLNFVKWYLIFKQIWKKCVIFLVNSSIIKRKKRLNISSISETLFDLNRIFFFISFFKRSSFNVIDKKYLTFYISIKSICEKREKKIFFNVIIFSSKIIILFSLIYFNNENFDKNREFMLLLRVYLIKFQILLNDCVISWTFLFK